MSVRGLALLAWAPRRADGRCGSPLVCNCFIRLHTLCSAAQRVDATGELVFVNQRVPLLRTLGGDCTQADLPACIQLVDL